MLCNDPPSALQERDPNTSTTTNALGHPNGQIYKLPPFTDLDDLENDENYQELSKACFKARNKAIYGSPKKRSLQKSTNKKSSPKHSKDKPPSAADLAHIHLDGEENENVPLYDTCDDVRTKIRAHLKKYKDVSQASLARDFRELMPQTKITANHVRKFLGFKGPRAGGHSPAFYGAYVYFEKLRIHQGKGKSKKREEVEEAWKKDGGFPR